MEVDVSRCVGVLLPDVRERPATSREAPMNRSTLLAAIIVVLLGFLALAVVVAPTFAPTVVDDPQ